MPRSPLRPLLGIIALQISLLSIGIDRDYRLKHEDNNALHATFARSHLQLGLTTTKGQNYFYSPASASGEFYAHHPPGPGLALASAYFLTGHDGPLVTRATAVTFHVLATILFFGLASRVMGAGWEPLLATLAFILLPESTFYGRMMNHEVLGLPAAILIVRGCWESLQEGARTLRWRAVCAVGCIWGALAGWGGFFVIAACALHAAWENFVRGNVRGRGTLALLSVLGVLLFAMDVAHLLWVLDGGVGYMRELLASRMGLTGEQSAIWAAGRIIEVHWRYFSLTGLLAVGALGFRGVRDLLAKAPGNPPVEVGLIFLAAGAGYVVGFNLAAARHDYWQFFLLPASAIAVTLSYRWLLTRVGRPARRGVHLALLVIAMVEFTVTAGFTLARRHLKTEGYAIETVEMLRRDVL